MTSPENCRSGPILGGIVPKAIYATPIAADTSQLLLDVEYQLIGGSDDRIRPIASKTRAALR